MTTADTFEELVEYYVNLLIIQYSGNQPKAQANILLLAELAEASGVYLEVENAYNVVDALGPIAVGKQLDVIGKYVGVDRFYTAINLINYFALVTYSQHASLPTSPPAFGLCTYATFGNASFNGTVVYNDIVTTENSLSDADFLTLIRFAILCNNMNYSAFAIDSALWEIFGMSLHAETRGNMAMTYFIIGPVNTLFNTMIFKGLLPAPMGVLINIVQEISGLMFAMTDYAEVALNVYSAFGSGFSTYSNYATLLGQTLTYSQITEG